MDPRGPPPFGDYGEEPADLATQCQEAREQRSRLLAENMRLQALLVSSGRFSQTDKEDDRSMPELEQQYEQGLQRVDELRRQLQEIRHKHDTDLLRQKNDLEDKESLAREVHDSFLMYKREVATSAVNSRNGKSIPLEQILSYEEREAARDADIQRLRLVRIRFQRMLSKLEAKVKQQEALADKLHLIDFEQLKIENQAYNERIEERNEELMNLRQKINVTVQVLSHFKEKLHFVQGENSSLKQQSSHLEQSMKDKRDEVATIKLDRDQLKTENARLKQETGLVGNEELLRDFRERKKALKALRDELRETLEQYSEVTGAPIEKTRQLRKLLDRRGEEEEDEEEDEEAPLDVNAPEPAAAVATMTTTTTSPPPEGPTT